MKTLSLLILYTIISVACLSQVNLSASMQTPTALEIGDNITELDCVFSLQYNDNAQIPSCSRNYSGKNLFFSFEMPESGQIRLEIIFKSEIDHGVALYYVGEEQWTELGCSQVISESSYIEYSDTALAGQIITGRIWINSGSDSGILKLRFDNSEEENGAKIPVIGVLSATPEELVNNVLISGCVQAFNIEFTGHPESIGFFTNGTPGLDFSSGIILSTGKANKVAGPNNSPATCANLQQPGDSLLTSIIHRATFDAAILEFDFVPSNNTISFQYAFGSEEYEEYVGGVFNDIFTFHISGGPENYQNVNMAIIPGTNTPVSINNVNQNQNTIWYTNNDNGANLQFDGMTKTITAVASVTPCQTYHIRLAVADAADPIFDSGVFLKAGSFNSGTIPLVKNIADWVMVNTTYEGCENNLVFARSDNNNIETPLDFNIEINGTAEMGVDYTAIPLSLQIPAGQESLSVPYAALIDGIAEGGESIMVKIFTGCECGIEFIEETIYINDEISVTGSISNNSPKCAGDTVQLSLNLNQFPEYYEIIWSTGNTGDTEINAVLLESQFVTAEVLYPCGSEIFSTWVNIMPLPEANVFTNAPICEGQDLTFSAENGVSYLWKGPAAYVSEISNPIILEANPTQSGLYGVTVTGANGCQYIEMLDISIHAWPTPILPESQVLCERDNLIINPGEFFEYQWLGPSNWTSNQNALAIESIIIPNSGTYFLTVSDEIGCTGSASTQIFVNPSPVAAVEYNYPVCRNENLVLSGTGDGSFLWIGPNSIYEESSTITIENVDFEDSGTYGFYVINGFNCSDSALNEIEITIPDATITAAENYCSATNNVILSSTYLGGIWSGAGITNPLTGEFSPAIAGSGSHSVGYYIGYPGCDDFQSINIIVEEAPQISLSADTELCSNQASIFLYGEPEGGLWSGTGITDSNSGTFNPSIGVIGTHTLIYSINSGACNISDSVNVTVFEGIDAQILPESSHCENEAPFYLHSVSSGGFWTGTGITNIYTGRFDPNVAGPGIHRIYHSINNQHCEDIDSIDLIIDEYFSVNIGEDLSYCVNQEDEILIANISGGLWSGFGISNINGTFSPSIAGIGTGTVIYSFTNGECFDADTMSVTVSDLISSDFTMPVSICEFEYPIQLISQNAGGVWSGNGITDPINGIFNPSVSGDGIWEIFYSVSNLACESSSSNQIEVIDAPDPSFVGNNIFCVNDSESLLQSVTTGGIWTGTGITDAVNGIFNPSIAGNGPSLVTYSVSNANCTSVLHQYLWVFDGAENISLNTPEWVCINMTDFVLQAEPQGGIWSGSGVINDSIFSPSTAGIGIHELTYSLGTGVCESSEIVIITIASFPTVNMISPDVVCSNDLPLELVADIDGGYWTGNAVLNGNFIPHIATSGDNMVYYHFDNGFCQNVYQYNVFVNTATPLIITGVDSSYCNNFGTVTAEFFPLGGTISGIVLSETNSFFTNDLVPGYHNLTYSFTNEYGCVSASALQTEILEVPEVLVSGVANNYCINSNDVSFHAVPWGGTVTGIEISGDSFSPSTTGIGEHFLFYSYTAPNGCSDSYLQSVIVHELPEIYFEILHYPSCANTQDAEIRVVVNNSSDFEIIWDNNIELSDNLLTGVGAGWHTVEVISEFGCIVYDSVFVIAPPELSVSINGTFNLLCFNSNNGVLNAVAVGGTEPYTYNWSVEDQFDSPNVYDLGPGTYYLTVEDSNHCQIIVEQSVIPAPEIIYQKEFTENLNCYDDQNGFINIIASAPELSIVWEDESTEFSINNLSAGIYMFTITDDSDCIILDSVEIMQNAEILVDGVINSVNCGNSLGSIITSTSGGIAPYQYLWSDGNETSELSDAPAGYYHLTVSDSNDCEKYFDFLIEANDSINAEISIVSEIDCQGNSNGSMQAISPDGVIPFNYLWSDLSTNCFLTGVGAGEYYLTIIDAQGCKGYASQTLTEPEALTVDIQIENVKCKGENSGQIILNTNGGTGVVSFIWQNESTGAIENNLFAGNYSFTATDENNCNVSEIVIVEEPIESMEYSIAMIEPKCWGEKGGCLKPQATGGTEPYSYSWETNGYTTNSQNVMDLNAGIYKLRITDANDCKIEAQAVLNQPDKIEIKAETFPVTCYGNDDGMFVLEAEGGVPPYRYFEGNNEYSRKEITDKFPGTYSVYVTDNNDCKSENTYVTIEQSGEDCLVIPNAFTPNDDGINDLWEITNIDMFPHARVQVFNRWGQVVFETVSDNEIWDGIYWDKLPAGTYIYIIDLNNGTASKTGSVSLVR